nr:relaxase/mobilization nuclease domain-containing protein [uncultured Steroidobacter sp.]
MARPIRLDRGEPLFDIGSYGRAGPGRPLSRAHIEQIRLTVTRAPEVMVKVSSGRGASTSRGVIAHLDYIGRHGELEIETDDGERFIGEAYRQLIRDWNLDLEEDRQQIDLFAINRRQPPKLVHRLIFSMPAGTPPQKVLGAMRDFAREEFGDKHRYAMVLHTDEPHPHVHVVVKAVSEQGERLNIRKETLRRWRKEFARQLRARGVAANATDRPARGQSRASKSDPIFRAARRGESSHMTARVDDLVRELKAGSLDQSGAARLKQTRLEVVRGWLAVRDRLAADGNHQLADQVSRFVRQMPPPRTEKQWLAADVIERAQRTRETDKPLVR